MTASGGQLELSIGAPAFNKHMQFDPERGAVDWDGLLTFFLTLLLLAVTLGIPLLICLRGVHRTATTASSSVTADQLLVFGKRLRHEQIDNDYRLRLQKAAELLHQASERQLLLLGGAADSHQLSESAAGETYLLNLGINPQRMAREEQSQNTLENLRHARDMLLDRLDRPVALISNRYHLARIQTMAESLGIPHRLCAAEPGFRPSWQQPPRLLIEAWYILWFKTGRGWARLIRSQRMLDRVT
jgi:uncharacterized SAM-binding protein YcdF (DUF218 family)